MRNQLSSRSAGLFCCLHSAIICCTLTICLGLPFIGFSQTETTIYDFDDDVKNYSTEIASDGATAEESVMAGTIYNYNSTTDHAIHFLNLQDDGIILSSTYYDDPNYEDERTVDVVCNGATSSAEYYITASARPSAGNQDGILILSVDKTGVLLRNVQMVQPTGGSDGLYPLHSIYLSSTQHLYVCGYYTDNNTGLPFNPDFTNYGNKKAFILEFDPVGGTVINFKTYETQYVTSTGATNDYDIAMRLVPMASGDIFVTGSVNGVAWQNSANYFYSALMNLVVDNNLNFVSEDHIGFDNQTHYPSFEYGTGLIEDGTNGSYIVGNTFYFSGSGGSGSSFDIIPAFLTVTWVNSSMVHTNSGDSRILFQGYDYAWALQTLTSCSSNTHTGGIRSVIAGLEINEWCSGGGGFSYSDYRPFLWDVGLDYNFTSTGNISFTNYGWTTYNSQVGTGTNTLNNSYHLLDNVLNHNAWNPTFAARASNSPNDDVILSVPRWKGGTSNLLNLKNVRADGCDLDVPACALGTSTSTVTGSPFCGVSTNMDYRTADANDHTGNAVTCTLSVFASFSNTPTPLVGTGSMITGSYSYNPEDQCAFSGSGNYKNFTTGINSALIQSDKTMVYPNPTKGDIEIAFAKSFDVNKDVSVRLVNLLGQVVSDLYTGKASLINKRINIGNVTPGVYMIKIISSTETVLFEKLLINP